MFCVTFVHIIHTNQIVDYYIIIIYELHVKPVKDSLFLQLDSVSIFRRTIQGYCAEGMHTNFKVNLTYIQPITELQQRQVSSMHY